MTIIANETDLRRAVDALVAIEPRFAGVLAACGVPPLRRMDGGLEGLLRIVTDQMISLKAGEAIWRRLRETVGPLGPEEVAARSEAQLTSLGLSGAKARAFRAIAADVAAGRFGFEVLERLDDQAAHRALITLPGVGTWTADIYLLAALGRGDAWPAGDLALQAAAQDLFGLAARPDPRRMTGLAGPWRPWRATAARLLWSHYRKMKGMPQAVG